MSSGHQRIKWRRNIAENFNRLSRVHERYRQTTDDRQTTDGRTTTYSEHEHEFTFAKNYRPVSNLPFLSKLLKRVVQNRLHVFLDSNDLMQRRVSAREPVVLNRSWGALRPLSCSRSTWVAVWASCSCWSVCQCRQETNVLHPSYRGAYCFGIQIKTWQYIVCIF